MISKFFTNRNWMPAFAGLAWVVFSALTLWRDGLFSSVLGSLKGLAINAVLICLFVYYYLDFKVKFSAQFEDLLFALSRKAFITIFAGLVLILVLGLSEQHFFSAWLNYQKLCSWSYLLFTFLVIDFVLAVYLGWRMLLLHEAYEAIKRTFQVFELALALTLLAHFFDDLNSDSKFYNFIQGAFLMMVLAFCLTMRWIAQFSLSQKRRVLLYVFSILASMAFLYWELQIYIDQTYQNLFNLETSLTTRILFFFVMSYGLSSVLMTVFNIPTSALFERKFMEVQLFAEIGESLQAIKNEAQVFEIFLNKALLITGSHGGWVESPNGEIWAQQGCSLTEIEEINHYINSRGHDKRQEKILERSGIFGSDTKFNSVMLVPLKSYKGQLAFAVLLKKQPQGFHNGNLSTVFSFAQQIGLIVQNTRFLRQTVENDRLQDQLSIAKQVQRNLLPQKLDAEGCFEIAAISKPAREMGGDYYDFISLGAGKFALIVADVSGNGLSAAFGMALLKGIFRATIVQSQSPAAFLCIANQALSGCLDKKTFVTAIVLIIDSHSKQINLACAGHCAPLYQNQNSIQTLNQHSGLGLAIARDERYAQFVVNETFEYEKNSLLVLYTDGVIESTNPSTKQEFGLEGLNECLKTHKSQNVQLFAKSLLESSVKFAGNEFVEDDSTVVCIRF
jgi:serine phosphatase RsbU (regulator of sigma subunit)